MREEITAEQFMSRFFNGICPSLYEIIMPPSYEYNCHAYALGITDRLVVGSSPSKCTINTQLFNAYTEHGYMAQRDLDLNIAPSMRKVLVYAMEGVFTHSALMRLDGRFESKLGTGPVIVHDADVLCDTYGGLAVTFIKYS